MEQTPLFFALDHSTELGENIAHHFDASLSRHEERDFAGGEHKARPLVDVCGRRVYVVHSLYGDNTYSANDKLCRLLFFIGAIKDAGADHVTAIVPYIAYARKDQRTKDYDPVITRYVANLFAAVGVDQIINLDVHNVVAQQNAHRCVYQDLDTVPLFVEYFARRLQSRKITVVSPDVGAIKKAQGFQQQLGERVGVDVEMAFLTKVRSEGVVTSSKLFGDSEGRTIIILDDMISSGTTVVNAIEACRDNAEDIFIAATHGVFTEKADRMLEYEKVREVTVTDSARSDNIDRAQWGERLQVLDSSGIIADAIRRDLGEAPKP